MASPPASTTSASASAVSAAAASAADAARVNVCRGVVLRRSAADASQAGSAGLLGAEPSDTRRLGVASTAGGLRAGEGDRPAARSRAAAATSGAGGGCRRLRRSSFCRSL